MPAQTKKKLVSATCDICGKKFWYTRKSFEIRVCCSKRCSNMMHFKKKYRNHIADVFDELSSELTF